MLFRSFLVFCVLIISESALFGFWFEPKWEDFQGGIHLVLEIESKGDSSVDKEKTERISQILRERLKQMGIKKPIIKPHGKNQIIVQLPKLKSPERVIDLISKSFFLEFRLVDEENSPEEALKGGVPPGSEILYQEKVNPGNGHQTKVPYLVRTNAYLTGEYITNDNEEWGQVCS